MTTRIFASSVLFAFAAAVGGCAASAEPTTSTKTSDVAQTTQALEGSRAPVYVTYEAEHHELDVQTCNIFHLPDQTGPHPCTVLYPDRHIFLVVALILDASGKVIGNTVVEDRPGGGCIHVSVPSAVAGGSIRVLALAKGMVADSPRTSVYFFNTPT